MKLAISSTGPSLDAEVDPRFGRCQYFIIVDPDTMEFEALSNSNAMAAGGAGISAGQMVASAGATVVLTGNCGPNAYQTLGAANIQVITGVTGKIRDAVQQYKAGKLQAISQPNVADHFGMGGGGMGRGGGRGMGRGMGMGPMAGPAPQSSNPQQELDTLKQQLEQMQQRIKDLEGKS